MLHSTHHFSFTTCAFPFLRKTDAIVDTLFFLPVLALVFIVLAATGVSSMVSGSAGFILFLILFAFQASVLPLTYSLSFLFEDPAQCQGILVTLLLLPGLILYMLYFILPLIYTDLTWLGQLLRYLCMLTPTSAVAAGMYDIEISASSNEAWSWDGGICAFVFLIAQSAVFTFWLYNTERRSLEEGCCGAMKSSVGAAGPQKPRIFDPESDDPINKTSCPCCIPTSGWKGVLYSRLDRDLEDDDVREERRRINADPMGDGGSGSGRDLIDECPASSNNDTTSMAEAGDDKESGRAAAGTGYLSSAHSTPEAIRVQHLRREFRAKGAERCGTLAVKDSCFGVMEGECFCLLGTNGAGKTTTIEMLLRELQPTSGDAFVAGEAVHGKRKIVESELSYSGFGFCPQQNEQFPELSCLETLEFFALLRGAPKERAEAYARWWCKRSGLSSFVDRRAAKLSGGNKRKLALAMSLVGRPSVAVLDEPTSGMDPAARRKLWAVSFSSYCIPQTLPLLLISTIYISIALSLSLSLSLCVFLHTSIQVVNAARRGAAANAVGEVERPLTVLMTTHYLEEAESLASRLAIMVRGQLSCFGSPLRVRNRYSDGYSLDVSAAEGETVDAACDFMRAQFPRCEVRKHSNTYAEALLGHSAKPADVMDVMFEAQQRLGLDHFSVHTSSIESIFIAKAKVAEEIEEKEREGWEKQRLAFRRRKRKAAARRGFCKSDNDDNDDDFNNDDDDDDDDVAIGSRVPGNSKQVDEKGINKEEEEEKGERKRKEDTCMIKLCFGLIRFPVKKCWKK